jgi:hypothetical protein
MFWHSKTAAAKVPSDTRVYCSRRSSGLAFGSSTSRIWSPATSRSASTIPLGRISMLAQLFPCPNRNGPADRGRRMPSRGGHRNPLRPFRSSYLHHRTHTIAVTLVSDQFEGVPVVSALGFVTQKCGSRRSYSQGRQVYRRCRCLRSPCRSNRKDYGPFPKSQTFAVHADSVSRLCNHSIRILAIYFPKSPARILKSD